MWAERSNTRIALARARNRSAGNTHGKRRLLPHFLQLEGPGTLPVPATATHEEQDVPMLTDEGPSSHAAIPDAAFDAEVAMMDCSDDNEMAGAPDKMPFEIDLHASAAQGRVPSGGNKVARSLTNSPASCGVPPDLQVAPATGATASPLQDARTPRGDNGPGSHAGLPDATVAAGVAMMDCSEANEMAGAHATTDVVPSRKDSAARGPTPLGDGQAAGSSSRHFDCNSDRTADKAGPGEPPGLPGGRRGSSTTPGDDNGTESTARHDAPANVASERRPLAAGTPGGGADVDLTNSGGGREIAAGRDSQGGTRTAAAQPRRRGKTIRKAKGGKFAKAFVPNYAHDDI